MELIRSMTQDQNIAIVGAQNVGPALLRRNMAKLRFGHRSGLTTSISNIALVTEYEPT